jgi:hypothetical protein
VNRIILAALFLIVFGQHSVLCSEGIPVQTFIPDGTSYFVGMPQMNIYADDFTTVVIKITSAKNVPARLFFATSLDPQFNEQKSIWFNIKGSSSPKEYIFNIRSQNKYWQGFVKQFIILPESGPSGISIESLAVCGSSPISSLRSGITEFWGPSGRVLVGSSVNNMGTLTVFGSPFNYYLYAIMILASLIGFGYYSYKGKNINDALRCAGKVAIIASIACWALWQASFLITESTWLKMDVNKYGLFTSLEYKQIAATNPNFYEFLQFCKKEMPERADSRMLTADPSNFFNTKAMYYLFPIILTSKDPEFLIVYQNNKDVGQTVSENKGYKLFKEFDKGAYILWKRTK